MFRSFSNLHRGDGLFTVVMGAAVLFVAWTTLSLIREDRRQERVVAQAFPDLVAATAEPLSVATHRLAPWHAQLTAVGPFAMAPSGQGSMLTWRSLTTAGCMMLRTQLVTHPEQGNQIELLQNGSVIDPHAYDAISCDSSGRTRIRYTFTLRPRA